jgi:hypothetical protein
LYGDSVGGLADKAKQSKAKQTPPTHLTPLVHPSTSFARFSTGQELTCELYDGVLASVGAVDLWVMTPCSLVGYTEA